MKIISCNTATAISVKGPGEGAQRRCGLGKALGGTLFGAWCVRPGDFMEILDDRVKMKLLDVIGTGFDISTWRMLFASMNVSCRLLNMCTIVVTNSQCTCTAESGQLFCFTFSASCGCGRHDLPRSCQHFRWWGGTDLHIWMGRAFSRAHCTGVHTWALTVHAFSFGDVWSILERIVNFKTCCVLSQIVISPAFVHQNQLGNMMWAG